MNKPNYRNCEEHVAATGRLVFRSLLSLDFFDSLLTKGKSRDKREHFVSSDPIQFTPIVSGCHGCPLLFIR